MALQDLSSELRHAARTLRRTPGFAVLAIVTLGLAIGALAALFAVVHTVLLRPLPFKEPDRLVTIRLTAPGTEMPEEFGTADEFYVHYREHSTLIEDLTTINSFTNTLRVGDRVERPGMSWPTSTMFSTLGVAPQLGRLPNAADEEQAVVITDQLWADWFGRAPDVLGRTVQIFGEDRTVIGVMPPEFRFPDNRTTLWISNNITAADITEAGEIGSPLVARLKPGVTPEQLAAELTTLGKALPSRFKSTPAYERIIAAHRVLVHPLEERMLGRFARPLWVLLAAAGLVLLIACANLANLFLVRAEQRYREMAVRNALGADRRQLLRLQIMEAVWIALGSAGLALLLATIGLPLLLELAPQQIPRLGEAAIGPVVIAVALVVAFASAIACALWPALRSAAPNLARLREGGRGLTSGRTRLRHALVVAQTALALTMLIGSGLLLRSVQALSRVDPGYDPAGIFTFQIAPERPSLTDAPTYARFHLDFLERLKALPGVTSVGLVENVPIDEGTGQARFHTERTLADGGDGTLLNATYTAGDYFPTMDIAMLAGQGFDASDHAAYRGHVIVSRSVAERLWPGQDAIGQRLQRPQRQEWDTVVGVVEDVMQGNLTDPPLAMVYFPLVGPDPARFVSSPGYVVKSDRPETIAPEIRALVREVAPEAPMYREYTMEGLVAQSMMQVTFLLLTLGIAASLALALGAIGLYGVLSCVVAERTREIGVRMALGARAQEVRRMIVVQGGRLVAIGIAIGLVVALASTRAIGTLLYGVQALDAPTFLAMSAAMLAVGMLASWLPARRASALNPTESLRRE